MKKRDWPRQIRIYAISVVVVFVVLFIWLRLTAQNGLDRFGNALAPDFVQFYVAGQMAARGEWRLIYDDPVFLARGNEVLGLPVGTESGYPFLYPPFVPWLCQPLAWMNYTTAATLYIIVNVGLALGLAWSIPRRLLTSGQGIREAGWLFLASLPLIRSLLYGQNGLASLAIVWAGYQLWTARREFWCGVVLALGAYKPQLFLGVWFWLMLFGSWRGRSGLMLGVVILGVSTFLGEWPAQPWQLWMETIGHLRDSDSWALQRHAIWNAFELRGPCSGALSIIRVTIWTVTAGVWLWTLITLRLKKGDGARDALLAWAVALWGWAWLTPRLCQYDLVMFYPAVLLIWNEAGQYTEKQRKWCRAGVLAWIISLYANELLATLSIPLVTVLGVMILMCVCFEIRHKRELLTKK